MTPEDYDRAHCRGVDPDLFWPQPTPDGLTRQEAAQFRAEQAERTTWAQELCTDCPVRQQCLDLGIKLGPGGGIWGGADMAKWRPLNTGTKRFRPVPVGAGEHVRTETRRRTNKAAAARKRDRGAA